MIKPKIEQDLKKAVEKLGFQSSDIVCTTAENPDFGDYSTNIALQLSNQGNKKSKQTPVEIASQILEAFGHPQYLERIEIASPGFINFWLKDSELVNNLGQKAEPVKGGKKILVEYGHTNPLKEIHIGHLRTFILGESISRLLDFCGNEVFRANYQGDIGLHIAKAIWGMKQIGLPTKELSLEEKAKYMGQAYAQGNTSYDADPEVKQQIDQINTNLYQKDPSVMEIYKLARDWSLEYFQPIYQLLNIKYDRCFFESEVFERGKEIVLENIGQVFKEDNGAVVFPGEDYGLHTRVFITSAGNPTYEGKEIGLAELEAQSFPYDQSIHVVANEQSGYFQVVIKVIEMIFPNLKGKKHHLSYGFVDLKEGKMSSRTGNVVTFDDLYRVISEKVREVMVDRVDQNSVRQIAIGAIKFAYLKYSPQPNMVFDLEESVSLSGDSGPYVQYAYVRTQSVLGKVKGDRLKGTGKIAELEKEERNLLRLIEYFDEIVERSSVELHPNDLCLYLLNLSKAFNLFYQKYPILTSNQVSFRLDLTKKVGELLKIGLGLLGIEAPERM